MRLRLLLVVLLLIVGATAPDAQYARLRILLHAPPAAGMVNVPDVVGLSEAAATSSITGVGLILGTVSHSTSPTVPSGDVISESPTAGTSVALGSAVNITVSIGPAGTACTSHPCIWLDTATLAVLETKEAAMDADWLTIKGAADALLSVNMASFTVTGVTKAASAEFTISEAVPWSTTALVYIGGGTGTGSTAWGTLNRTTAGYADEGVIATKTGTNTFTVPINTSAVIPSFAGETIAIFAPGWDRFLSDGCYNGDCWRGDQFALGLAYKVTGTAAYCTKAREQLRYIAKIGKSGINAPVSTNSDGYPVRNVAYGYGLGLDWCHDQLTMQEISDLCDAQAVFHDWIIAPADATHSDPLTVYRDPSENHWGGMVYGFGIASLAMQTDCARGDEIATYWRNEFDTVAEASFAPGGDLEGGFQYEGHTYGNSHWRGLMEYLAAIKSATGEDIASTSRIPVALARNLIYAVKPNGWQFHDEADYAGNCTGVGQPLMSLELIPALAGHVEAEWMQYYYDSVITAEPTFGCTPSPAGGYKLMWYNAAATATDYTATEPLAYFSPGDKHTSWRTDWTSSSVWATMKGSVQTNVNLGHENKLAGHIGLQRGSDYFLVNANTWKGSTGVSGTPENFNGGRARGLSMYGNTLYHQDGGNYTFSGDDYKGGQGVWGVNDDAYTQHQEDTPEGWAYQKAKLDRAYCMNEVGCSIGSGSPSLTDWHRSVFFEGSGVLVVYDYSTHWVDSAVDAWMLWHLNMSAAPSTASNVVSQTIGSSKMYLKVFAGTGLASTITESRDTTLANGTGTNITYRETVTDASPGLTFRTLTGIVVGASGMSLPTMSTFTSTGSTMYGTQITDSAGTIHVNLFSADNTTQTGVTYAVTATGTLEHHVPDLTPLTQYYITQDGTRRFTRVSSSAGVIAFTSTNGGTFVVSAGTDQVAGGYYDYGSYVKYAGLITPGSGETFTAPAELRLIGLGFDNSPAGGSFRVADYVEFYSGDDLLATVQDTDNDEYWVLKTRVTGLAAGTHKIWERAYFSGGTYADSPVHTITVNAAPTYAETITLSADLDISGLNYSKDGSTGARIKFVGNGYRVVGTPTSFLCDYCEFFDMGDRTATADSGLTLTLSGSGTFTLTNSRFETSDITSIAMNSSGTMTITGNTWGSNNRQPLGNNAAGSGQAHGSYPILSLTGSGAGAKTLQSNNVGAGWIAISSPNWTIGGTTSALGNILQGARVGIFLSSGFTAPGGWGHNYANHLYLGGWSEGSVYELGNVTGLTIEHDIVTGSSWPIRGLSSELRYSLVTSGGGTEGNVWTGTSPANIHHNILWAACGGRGIIYQINGATGTTIRNNTIEEVDKVTCNSGTSYVELTSGTATFNSNLVLRSVSPAVYVSGATVTASYNAFYDILSPSAHYSDARATPTGEVSGDTNPGVTGYTDENVPTPWNYSDVWTRTKTVAQILADWRTAYTPTSGVIDNGDTATYGAGNDQGAVGAGTSNANDLFGTTTP